MIQTKINKDKDTILNKSKEELKEILLDFDDDCDIIENDIVFERSKLCCNNKECKYWIDYEKEGNCTLETINKNPEGLSFREIGERLGITADKAEKTLKVAMRKIFHALQK